MRVRTPIIVSLLLLAPCNTAFGQVSSAYLIRVVGGNPVVEPISPDAFPPPVSTRGLLVWSDATGDRWLRLADDKWQQQLGVAKRLPTDKIAEGEFSRGSGEGSSETALVGLSRTTPVDPANITEKFRGGELVTPSGGTVRQNAVVRRLPEDDGEKFPAASGELTPTLPKGEPQKVAFPAGSDRFKLPDLKPGRYLLSFPSRTKGLNVNLDFEVEGPGTPTRQKLVKVDGLKATLSDKDPLNILFEVETLLGATAPRNGVPFYAGDILDILEAQREGELSPYLLELRDRLRKQLAALAKNAPVPMDAVPDPDAVGIPSIDAARNALLAGRYKDAEAALSKTPEDNPRAARLAKLYRAVLLAEAGAGADADAEDLFAQATEDDAKLAPADRFRTHTNFALFYHRRAQDRLNNHTFQMAAGVSRTITAVVADWQAARAQYDLALKAANPRQAAGLAPDIARLNALFADLVRTLDGGATDLVIAADAAADAAGAAAEKATDPITRGIALELRGQLALRQGKVKEARALAEKALAEYIGAGFLPGVENAHRLLGQISLKANDTKGATRHLMASYLVAELLRDRFASDRIGRTRAGFFARRAFVLDTLVELNLGEKNFTKALEFAELAKARAFTDLLATDGVNAKSSATRSLADILKAWPKDTAALEYFFAKDKVWVFLVTPAGEVRAVELRDAKLEFVKPRELLTRVRQLVGSMEGTARKMANRILNDEGFDNSWQDELHALAGILLPESVRQELKKEVKVVLLAPQHVLHYLPFAALVLEKDPEASEKQLARPKKFLIDEPFALVNVPSIVAWDMLQRPQAKLLPAKRAANAVGLVQAPGQAKLEGVAQDLENLRETFGADVRDVLAEQEATPSRARDLFPRRGLLLLATHGYNNADSPLDGFLVLYPDGDKNPDGFLRARDIYQQTVNADIVIMSACYTGLGDRSPLPSDDLFGLQRAFLQAGAKSVIAGLWDVWDKTAPELMRGCMERLAAGTPVAQSLKETQKAFLDKRRALPGTQLHMHPYFWAVYTVLGNDQARVGTR